MVKGWSLSSLQVGSSADRTPQPPRAPASFLPASPSVLVQGLPWALGTRQHSGA